MTFKKTLGLVAISIYVGACGSASPDDDSTCADEECSEQRSCEIDGKVLPHGESTDEECGCTCDDGTLVCASCEPKSCELDGEVYQHAESYEQDCNTCTCDDGEFSCTSKSCEPKTCVMGGKIRELGFSMLFDACNSCHCTEDGVLCDDMPCEPESCEYAGETYAHGDSMPAPDGCNTCTCNQGEADACTEVYCPPPLTKCEDSAEPANPESGIGVTGVRIDGNFLIVTAEYPEGCAPGQVDACWGPELSDNTPPQTSLTLGQPATDDQCGEPLEQEHYFSLSGLLESELDALLLKHGEHSALWED